MVQLELTLVAVRAVEDDLGRLVDIFDGPSDEHYIPRAERVIEKNYWVVEELGHGLATTLASVRLDRRS